MKQTHARRSTRGPARPGTPLQASRRRSPIDKRLDPALFKALGNPTRLRLLACIAKCGRGCAVSEIGECCRVDLSVVSRHLAHLARAGVLEVERLGRETRYRVRYESLAGALRALADAVDGCCPECSSCGCDPRRMP